jgi:hypothetical protein
MPGREEILTGLARIANEGLAVAIGWHVVVAALLLALLLGWRPAQRWLAMGLALPLASVAAFAWRAGNPFNGSVFAVLAVGVALLGARASHEPVAPVRGWRAAAGALLLVYAWIYPHFLDGAAPTVYLYAAPVGLVPCPTLALVIALALMTSLDARRAQTRLLAGAGGFYALFGALRLGVWLDAGLLAGALALAIAGMHRSTSDRLPLRAPRALDPRDASRG